LAGLSDGDTYLGFPALPELTWRRGRVPGRSRRV
jgi:hypothetical protein